MLIKDLPIWEEYPHQHLLQDGDEIRRGFFGDLEIVVINDPVTEIHIDLSIEAFASYERTHILNASSKA